MRKSVYSAVILAILGACAELPPEPYEPSKGHISAQPAGPDEATIPDLVTQAVPALPEPSPPEEQETYTVVVNEVPVKELLFALARDAKINVDVDPRIDGVVTLNGVDQTLAQLIDRIARQVNLRYEFSGENLFIMPDEPFYRSYHVDYVNLTRGTTNAITIATQIASTAGAAAGGGGGGGGGGGNNSTTEVSSSGINNFWGTLVANVSALLGESVQGGSGGEIPVSENVIPHPETGILTVKATAKQHELVQQLIDKTVSSGQRQVLIQATIVEVELTDKYQAGIDWSFINNQTVGKAGFDFVSTTLTGVPVNTISSFLLQYRDPNPNREQIINGTLRLLEEFGDVSVLSSPQIMTLNNQTAILKVVNNIVYFEVESQTSQTQTDTLTTVETTVKTVPVGIVMMVTPQINDNDSVMLNVRPTISSVNRFITDPNPTLTVDNLIPEISVREMESMLRMNNGQIAVLGGLMTDQSRSTDAAIPGLSRIPVAGEAFKSRTREITKTELVIFLRPLVIRNPSVESDLKLYKAYLPGK